MAIQADGRTGGTGFGPAHGCGSGRAFAGSNASRTGYKLEKARVPRHSMRQINDYR